MGNCVSTRKITCKSYTKINSLELHPSENDSKKNNLELYLNDVYEKECELKIEEEETEFIRTGIETLTQDIADKVLETLHVEFEDILKPFGFNNTDVQFEEIRYRFIFDNTYVYHFQNSITELYFPGTCGSFCKEYPHPHKRNSILKVGSFYEGTRNSFPDEFDYIFLLFRYCNKYMPPFHAVSLLFDIHPIIEGITAEHRKSLHYGSNCDLAQQGSRKIYFDKYVKEHGPASMLQFVYINSSGEARYIHVDLTPAIRLTSDIDLQSLPSHFAESESFKKAMLSARNYSYIGRDESYTETEVYFISNVLSEKHIKVFRILKHLINGHDGEEIKEVYPMKCIFTSYTIKLYMIKHHDCCENNITADKGPCVIQVLNGMRKGDIIIDRRSYLPKPLNQLPYIKKMIKRLKSMQTSEDSYDYERYKTKSIARQYLDDKEKCVIL